MRSLAPALLVLAALAAPATGQVTFGASLDGSWILTPVENPAGGWARLTLDVPSSVLSCELHAFGLEGLSAHLHDASGAIKATLAGGPALWTGATAPLSAAEINALLQGSWYLDVHSGTHPGGDIRGAVRLSPAVFGAQLGGAQVVPSSGSANTGQAMLDLAMGGSVVCALSAPGISGTSAHLHEGPFGSGAPGTILDTFPGGGDAWFGFSAPLTPLQIAKLQAGELYVDVHSAALPGGEIRGQVVPSSLTYGPMSDPGLDVVQLDVLGAPVDTGADGTGFLMLRVTHGTPSAPGFMLAGPAPAAALLKDEPLLVDLGGASAYALHLDETGILRADVKAPPLAASFDLYLQFVCLDPAAPNGQFLVSNGVRIPFTKF